MCDACTADSENPTCAICQKSDNGAFKSVQADDHSHSTPGQQQQQQWAHVNCAIYTPNVYFVDVERREPVAGISKIPPDLYQCTCMICKEKRGAAIRCMHHSCRNSFHVSCALNDGECKLGFDKKGNRYAYCPTHVDDV